MQQEPWGPRQKEPPIGLKLSQGGPEAWSMAALRDLNEKLLDAAKKGDSQDLRRLLEAGADKARPAPRTSGCIRVLNNGFQVLVNVLVVIKHAFHCTVTLFKYVEGGQGPARTEVV